MAVLFVFSAFAPLKASLAIFFYNNDALFVGEDSMVAHPQGTNYEKIVQTKIFRMDKQGVVTMTGYLGTIFTHLPTGKQIDERLFVKSESICKLLDSSPAPISDKLNSALEEYRREYQRLMEWNERAETDLATLDGTRICFIAYEPTNGVFFGLSYLLSPTNRIGVLEKMFERASNNNGGLLFFQGEDSFLSALVRSSETNFTSLRTEKFNNFLNRYNARQPLTDEQAVDGMLEMFRLQAKYASKMSTDKGLIGEPYIIYKINRQEANRLH